ncbi:MAG: bifunctional diaminohydroxyphosphoribosylaminopyrimidine deaminase/5-amino-6-(5-phosphoribosylamino)uracil reductase RibD, partial [Bacteroidota bacterium]
MKNQPRDVKFLKRSLELAKKGAGAVSPNPQGGCVIVRKGKVVGVGFHRRFGGPHAEVEALRKAGRRAQGATLYVNLEPCSHFGKTPPCVDAIVESGITRV